MSIPVWGLTPNYIYTGYQKTSYSSSPKATPPPNFENYKLSKRFGFPFLNHICYYWLNKKEFHGHFVRSAPSPYFGNDKLSQKQSGYPTP